MKKILVVLLLAAALAACGGKKPRTAPGQIQPGSAEYLANEGVGYLNQGHSPLPHGLASQVGYSVFGNQIISIPAIHHYRCPGAE